MEPRRRSEAPRSPSRRPTRAGARLSSKTTRRELRHAFAIATEHGAKSVSLRTDGTIVWTLNFDPEVQPARPKTVEPPPAESAGDDAKRVSRKQQRSASRLELFNMTQTQRVRFSFRNWALKRQQRKERQIEPSPAEAASDVQQQPPQQTRQQQQQQATHETTEADVASPHEGMDIDDARAKRARGRAAHSSASPGTPAAKRTLALPPGPPPPSNSPRRLRMTEWPTIPHQADLHRPRRLRPNQRLWSKRLVATRQQCTGQRL